MNTTTKQSTRWHWECTCGRTGGSSASQGHAANGMRSHFQAHLRRGERDHDLLLTTWTWTPGDPTPMTREHGW